MPKSVNKVILMGYLGKNPDIKGEQSPKASLSLATTEWIRLSKTPGDEFTEQTTWHRVQVWGKAVEKARSLQKGDFIYVEGKLEAYNYEDEVGRKQTLIYVKAWDVIPCITGPKKQPVQSGALPQSEEEAPF